MSPSPLLSLFHPPVPSRSAYQGNVLPMKLLTEQSRVYLSRMSKLAWLNGSRSWLSFPPQAYLSTSLRLFARLSRDFPVIPSANRCPVSPLPFACHFGSISIGDNIAHRVSLVMKTESCRGDKALVMSEGNPLLTAGREDSNLK